MDKSSKHLTILHFNDVYNIEEKKNEPVAGAARFKTALDSCKDPDTLIFFSGDAFQPSFLSTAYDGEQMIKPLNIFGVNAACFGNHEFDLELDQLTDFIAQTTFPWIFSNLKTREEWKPVAGGVETAIIEKNGIKIGLMGLAEEEWVNDSSSLEGCDLEYEDFVDCAKRLTIELREKEKCDLVIALTHFRNHNDFRLAKEFTGLDLILGGHDHVNLIQQVNGTYCIKSGSDFEEFNKISLDILPSEEAKALPQEEKDKLYKERIRFGIETIKVTKKFEPNQELQKHVTEYLSQFQEKMKQPVLHCTVELDTRFDKVRGGETNFGNFIADILKLNSGCDVAMINTGTFRSNCIFPSGILTLGDITMALPWEDLIMKLRLTGKQLWEALENSVSTYPVLDGRFCGISGVTFSFDPKAPAGKRIPFESIEVNDLPLDLDWQYTLATKLYMYLGKDGYTVLKQAESLVHENTAEEIHTILKKVFALAKDPFIVEDFKNKGTLDASPNNAALRKLPSLERRFSAIKRIDFYTKIKGLIKDVIVDENGESFLSVGPEIEGRVKVLEQK